jgi:L-threonylcarbamoyladenylate synthase
VLRAVLPGPYTLVVANPARRFPWLAGGRPDAIGVRVPRLPGPALDVVAAVGAVAATSANLAGGPDPRSTGELVAEIRDGVDAIVDGGALPGTPSTVVDLTGPEPVVLRAGAVGATEALRRIAGAGAPQRSPGGGSV